MSRCWKEEPLERPSFTEIAEELEDILTNLVGYSVVNEGSARNVTYSDFSTECDNSENEDAEEDDNSARMKPDIFETTV